MHLLLGIDDVGMGGALCVGGGAVGAGRDGGPRCDIRFLRFIEPFDTDIFFIPGPKENNFTNKQINK